MDAAWGGAARPQVEHVYDATTQRLSVTAQKDASLLRSRNALPVLGLVPRSMMGHFRDWRRRTKNKRQATLNDFCSAMSRSNQREGWRKIRVRQK